MWRNVRVGGKSSSQDSLAAPGDEEDGRNPEESCDDRGGSLATFGECIDSEGAPVDPSGMWWSGASVKPGVPSGV